MLYNVSLIWLFSSEYWLGNSCNVCEKYTPSNILFDNFASLRHGHYDMNLGLKETVLRLEKLFHTALIS